MSRYAPLFSVTVGHGFFADDACPAVGLALDAPSATLAARAGLLVRTRPGRIAVLHDESRRDALAMWAADGPESFRLDLQVTSGDPLFSDYTEPGTARDGAILAFDGATATPDPEGGRYRLSKEEYVSEQDFEDLTSDRVTSALTPRALLVRPLALIRIPLADEAGALLDPGDGDAGRAYRIDLRARETYWRYLLLGDLAERTSSITDLDMGAQFDFGGEALLPGNRKALAFRSTTRIPLSERSDRRFQLRLEGANGSGNGRVLVKRLPVATPRGIYRETIDGESAFVSDIFVNG